VSFSERYSLKRLSMRFKHILLISPTYEGSFYEEPQPNPCIGLGCVAECLAKHNINYSVLDMTLGYTVEDVVSLVKSKDIDLVGITMMSFKYRVTHRLISDIKRACPGIEIVIGGAHPSSWKADALSACPDIDYAVVGEGEYPAVELCQGKALSEIKGLIYRDGNEIVFTGPRDFISDLDVLQFPRYGKFETDRYKKISISTSRGCPFRCIYCASHLVLGRKWRSRSADSVISEIEYWYKKGRRLFGFSDDNFTYSRERVADICTGLREKGMTEATFTIGGIRADKIDVELLKMLQNVGISGFGIGVEGGNDKVLKELKKGEKMDVIESAIKNACELGFEVKLYFIIGSPYETWDDFMDSIHLAERYPVDQVNFYSMMPVPHTELYEWVEDSEAELLSPVDDYLNNSTPWDREPFYDGPGMSLDEKRKALALGLRTRRKVSARKRLSQKLGRPGKMVADFIHDSDFVYNAAYNGCLKRVLKRTADMIAG